MASKRSSAPAAPAQSTPPPVPARVPRIGEGKRGPEGHLLYLLRQAQTVARQALERELLDLRLNQAQYSVLTMVRAYDGLSSADVARLSMLTPQSTNETVRTLERRGLLARRPDAAHAKVLRLALTAEGAALLRRARARSDRVEHAMARVADAEESAAVRRWLVAVAVALSDHGQTG